MLRENGVAAGHDVPANIADPWTETSFSSAVKVKETRPAVRRRGSDGATWRNRGDHEPSYAAHSRARTLDTDVARPAHSHPLASPSSIRGVREIVAGFLSAHDTRPHMKRVLSDAELPPGDEDGTPDDSNGQAAESRSREEERVMIMHEVLSNDSLAGVAVKYGVSLPDLRRWNQLWPSDPIHLRKILYIPLEKARHAKHFRLTSVEVEDGAVQRHLESLPAETAGETADANSPDKADAREPLIVVRVPASQLSFFPPPSTPLSTRGSQTTSHNSRSRPTLSPSFTESPTGTSPLSSPPSAPYTSLGFSFNSPPHGRSLGGLFTSARNTFVERLSLDSNSATTSAPSDDQDLGHELEDVSAVAAGRGRPRGVDSHGRYEPYTRNRGHITGGEPFAKDEALEMDPLLTTRSHVGDKGRTPDVLVTDPSPPGGATGAQSKAAPYDIPDSILTSPTVRTAQLEPSPVMHLPPIRKKTTPSGG
ncbi:uncharacterized protein C8Q71DRAFT_497996 [Rhodofomes roseus]|uniref:LysM domain-containing protein n=1 Tax=Rhodofomes roseus TaxID=34475 RepID=A0ABQ8KLE6_9APHY|nr:uncharacterized protein C8Q71DRAFT_497996 [Rhodofomes roseus]KAH9839133.1 hypothetical protein C8Q71DRAFT_497996 [Rhodofomes roseus]